MDIRFFVEYFAAAGETLHITSEQFGSLPMRESSAGCWEAEVTAAADDMPLQYAYSVKIDGDERRREWSGHRLHLSTEADKYLIYDSWNDIPDDMHYRSTAFAEAIFARREQTAEVRMAPGDIVLKVEAPSLRPWQRLAVAGGCELLGGWNPDKAAAMTYAGCGKWCVSLDAKLLGAGFEYKIIVMDSRTGRLAAWETGDNRYCSIAAAADTCTIVSGLRLRDPLPAWRGAGTAIPVFSLRSEKSFGVGEFADLKLMVDWAAATGQSVVQILPVNDTTMYGTWQDSYPYNANSTFALHPQYLRLTGIGEFVSERSRSEYERLQRELNSLTQIDYVRVNDAKQRFLRELFAAYGRQTFQSKEFRGYYNDNRSWLVPYSAYCALRDKFRTPEFTSWGDYATYDTGRIEAAVAEGGELHDGAAFAVFVQYHLHRQLAEVRDYAHSRGIVLKGDIPIGISRTSADAWSEPALFNMDSQAGAPPDDFSVTGQNWGFPTYDWQTMAADGYGWWRARFRNMAKYFDAYRIDHILGFFRIWEIPADSLRGILGHFNPALPFSADDIRERGLRFNPRRHAEPYLYVHMLPAVFGSYADDARRDYLDVDEYGRCTLRGCVATQRDVAALFAGKDDERSYRLRDGFMRIIEDVLFVEDPRAAGMYHPRIAAHETFSYRALPENEKQAFDRMYDDFFYHRHDAFWRDTALQRLAPLIASTGMLVCGEDLGMIPHCVPEVMAQLQILSLEIQRMPKKAGESFGDMRRYPYLSVCTTSTHDMTPLRAWWEQERERSREYYNEVLHGEGEAPYYCEPWLCGRIVELHLQSSSMLTVLPLQDWLSVDGLLRRDDPQAERINIPADPRHYWRYRMHLTLEELLAADEFNGRIRDMVCSSGRYEE